jgi:YVTN family beta-propeller protein
MGRIMGRTVLVAAAFLLTSAAAAQVYVANVDGGTVSVIDTSTNAVLATITVGSEPRNLAMTPNGSRVYVPNRGSDDVSVISTATNTVIATVTDASFDEPYAAAVTADGSEVWIANKEGGGSSTGSVTIISTATNTVIDTISDPCFVSPEGIAVNPVLDEAYVISRGSGAVCTIDRTLRTVTDTIVVGGEPRYGTVLPDGSALFVSRIAAGAVGRINTATNALTTIPITGTPRNMAVTVTGSAIYMGLQSGDLGMINTATNVASLIPLAGASSTYGVAVTTTRAYVTDENNETVHVVNIATNTEITGTGLPVSDPGFNTPRAIAALAVAPPAALDDVPALDPRALGALAVLLATVAAIAVRKA